MKHAMADNRWSIADCRLPLADSPATRRSPAWIASLFAWVLAGLLLPSLTRPAFALELSSEQKKALLNEALQAFDKGEAVVKTAPAEAHQAFAESAAKFQLLADQGARNGKLYYNLANAYLESGNVGRAVLNYRRALAYRPADTQVEDNLGEARKQLKTPLTPPPESSVLKPLLFWHYGLAFSTRLWLAVGLYVAFWLALMIRLVIKRFPWRFVLTPTLALSLALGTSAAVQWVQTTHEQAGVILADDTTLRKGNGEGFEPLIQQKLCQGIEFQLLEKRGDWLNIRLPDGKEGWVRTSQAEII